MLLVMGLGCQLSDWPIELCDDLVKPGYRVIRYDNRDVGLSTKFDAAGAPNWTAISKALAAGKPAPLAYTLDDMAKDAVELLDRLGIKRAHIVGVSMGGSIAQLFAVNYPEHTLSLTSIMASTGNPTLPKPKPEAMAALTAPAPPADDVEAIVVHYVKIWKTIGSTRYPTPEQTLRDYILRDVKRSYYPAGGARQLAAVVVADGGTNDRRAKLKTIKVPTVVLHDADDPVVPVEAGRDAAANIPGAELRIILGMGHDLPVALVPAIADAITAAAGRATGDIPHPSEKISR